MRDVFDRLVQGLVVAAHAIVSHGGPTLGYGLARVLGRTWFALSSRRRRTISRNLEIAFGDRLTARERRRIGRRCCEHAIATGVEMMMRDRLLAGEGWRDHFEIDAATEDLLTAEHPRGLVIISGHLGSWEMGQYFLGRSGRPATPVVRALDNPRLDRHVATLRSRFGNTVLDKHGALRGMLRILRRGGIVAIVPDQNATDGDRFFRFFDVPAATHASFAEVAVRLGADVAASVCLRRGLRFRFRIVTERLDVPRQGSPRDEADALLRQYLDFLERCVRENPEQYMWMHRRWKTRPPGGDPLY